MKKQPVYLHSMLAPSLSLPSPITEIKQRYKYVASQGHDQYRRKSFSLLCPVSLEQPAAVCPFSHFICYLQETSQGTSLWLGLSPIDTRTLDSSLMPRNCFTDFAVEHRFGCGTTEPGFIGDIGVREIWLIDWKLLATIDLCGRAFFEICVAINRYNISLAGVVYRGGRWTDHEDICCCCNRFSSGEKFNISAQLRALFFMYRHVRTLRVRFEHVCHLLRYILVLFAPLQRWENVNNWFTDEGLTFHFKIWGGPTLSCLPRITIVFLSYWSIDFFFYWNSVLSGWHNLLTGSRSFRSFHTRYLLAART